MATSTSKPTFEYDKEEFRVCPQTSYRVHKPAESLMILHAVVAVLCLSVGGIAALIIGLEKMPGGPDLVSDIGYYQWVSIHGFSMLIFWIVWFEIAAAYFCVTALLNSKLASPRVGWVTFGMMLAGTLMIYWTQFFDVPNSIVMFTAYYPLKAHWVFYLGYIIFAVGVLLGGVNFFYSVYLAQKTGSYPYRSLPLTVYGVFVALIIAVQAILNGAIVLIISFLYSVGILDGTSVDADFWKQVFWGFGHTAQYINITATAAIWYALIHLTIGAKPLSEKYSRMAFLFYLVFTIPVAAHHLIVDPAYSLAFKMVNATLLALGLAVPSLIHAFVIPGAMEKEMRLKNPDADKSLFGWLRELPWDEPGIPAVFWSVLLFGIGGILGSIQGTYQLNMITHNTLRINGHFHLTVVAGTTIAFMGLAYYFIELIPRRKIILGKLKSYQIHLYAAGLFFLSMGMFIAGVQGAPRRTATYGLYDADGYNTPSWDFGLWMLGFGAILAVLGGILFVFLIVVSLFFGKKLPKEGDWSQEIPPPAEPSEDSNPTELEAPGTFAIGILFMIVFLVFYITTFLVLSLGWSIHR